MKKQKIILVAFLALLLAVNAAFFSSSQGFVQQFAKSVFHSRQAAAEKKHLLESFDIASAMSAAAERAKAATGGAEIGDGTSAEQYPVSASPVGAAAWQNLGANELKILEKRGEFFKSTKLDANKFFIVYYQAANGRAVGFSGQFELTQSRLWANYVLIFISILSALVAYAFYRRGGQEIAALNAKNAALAKRIEKEQKAALADPVTGLGSKTSLLRSLAAMKAPKIILADVLDFRKITDYFDSSSADDLLRQLSFILSEFAAKNNLEIYYIEGDHFAFLQDSNEDLEYYEEILTELIELVKGQEFSISYEQNSFDIVLSITLGMCLESENVLRKAQIALARAKAEYKNFVCYAKYLSDEKNYLETLSTAKNIKDAVSNNEILPFFQPIYDRSGKICKYESLVRIVKKTPEGMVVLTPQSFLAISVKMKQYEQIEGFIINKVIKTLQERPEICLSVNLSARDMSDSVQNARFLSQVRAAGVAERLIIEVLEDEDISQNMRIKDFLRRAKDLGCKIAIDDFGSGFSNFAYLLELMPHYIKIDGSIVRNICDDEKSQNILKTIVLFSKSLGIRTVAEFVATKEIYELCYELGVDEFQGFYLGKPSPSFTPEEIDLGFYKLDDK